MDDIKCICGRSFKSKTARGTHHAHCKQWRDYFNMMAADPDVQKKLAEVVSKDRTIKDLAKELDITAWAVSNLLQLQGRTVLEQTPVSSGMVVELTPQQIIEAIRLMLEEHATATKTVAELKSSVETAEKRLVQVSAELTQKKAELQRVRERELEPIKFQLAREAIERQRESH